MRTVLAVILGLIVAALITLGVGVIYDAVRQAEDVPKIGQNTRHIARLENANRVLIAANHRLVIADREALCKIKLATVLLTRGAVRAHKASSLRAGLRVVLSIPSANKCLPAADAPKNGRRSLRPFPPREPFEQFLDSQTVVPQTPVPGAHRHPVRKPERAPRPTPAQPHSAPVPAPSSAPSLPAPAPAPSTPSHPAPEAPTSTEPEHRNGHVCVLIVCVETLNPASHVPPGLRPGHGNR